MKYINKIFILTILLISMVSCKKFLDTKPQDFLSPEIYYNSESELNAGLAAVYDVLGGSSTYGLNMLCRLGLEGDEGFYARATYTSGVQVYNITSSTAEVNSLWQDLYKGISRANVLLANADKNPAISDTFRIAVKGQALFLRGYYYFLLVQNFGGVPLILSPVGSTDGNNIARATTAATYAQILQDMEEAENMVPDITSLGYGGKVSKSAVRGILSRVCLYMAGQPLNQTAMYDSAYYWAKKVINSGVHSLNPDYTQIFINYAADKYDIKESIWEVEFWGNTAGAYNEVGYVGSANGIPSASTIIGQSYGYLNTTAQLYDRFGTGDLRRDWSVAPFTYTATGGKAYLTTTPNTSQKYSPRCGKFRREYEVVPRANYYTPENFPLLRYADVLLMAAEGINGAHGPNAEAIEYVNEVRRRGYGLPVNAISGVADLNADQMASKTSFQTAIEDERSRELCFEALRKPDLIRWGLFVPTMKQVLDNITSFAPTAYYRLAFDNVSAQDLLLPIPEHEMSVNKALTQNPTWQ